METKTLRKLQREVHNEPRSVTEARTRQINLEIDELEARWEQFRETGCLGYCTKCGEPLLGGEPSICGLCA